MAKKKKVQPAVTMRTPNRLMGERGGARYHIRPIEPTGASAIGGFSPSGIGQVNI